MKRILLTLTLVLFIAPFAMAQDLHSYIPTDGLVAYYPFNGNVNDTSGNNYNLVNNNVTYDSDRFGTDDSSAAYFSGNASELYLEESISQLTSDPRQTFTFWFKSITPSNRYIFEYASQSNARFRFVTSPTGGIGIRGETGCNSGGRDYVIPNLHEGWHHFVIAIDTQTYTVYYDGKVLYNASHSGFDCTDNVNKLNLGNDIGGGAKEYTNMLMDDIGIWNRVLSEQEIQNLYTSSNGDILLNGTVSAENNQIKNVADPTDAQDTATKSYVDTNTSKTYTQLEVDALIANLQQQIDEPAYTIGYHAELGGYVFMISADGKSGLVAEIEDQGVETWYNAQNLISNPSNHSTVGKNFTDWRLPTRYELAQMYTLKTEIESVGGDLFGSKTYWTSNQSVYSVNGLKEETAWRQNFGTGLQYNSNNVTLNSDLFVRSIREF
jgi:hypothetical protein